MVGQVWSLLPVKGELIFQEGQQVLAILVTVHDLCLVAQLSGIDETKAEGNLLRAGDHHALAVLDGLNEITGLEKGFMGACIQPGNPTPQNFNPQLVLVQVDHIQVCNLNLTPGRRLKRGCKLSDVRIIIIYARDRIMRARFYWFLFNAEGKTMGVKLDHAIPFRISNRVSEDECTLGELGSV